MSWSDVVEQLRVSDVHYVKKGDERQVDIIREAVLQEFPDYEEDTLEEAIKSCMDQMDNRDPHQVFLNRLEKELEGSGS